MSWYDEMVAAGRSKSLTTGNVRCGVAAVHEVLGSLALETTVNCHSELMEDSTWRLIVMAETRFHVYFALSRSNQQVFLHLTAALQ